MSKLTLSAQEVLERIAKTGTLHSLQKIEPNKRKNVRIETNKMLKAVMEGESVESEVRSRFTEEDQQYTPNIFKSGKAWSDSISKITPFNALEFILQNNVITDMETKSTASALQHEITIGSWDLENGIYMLPNRMNVSRVMVKEVVTPSVFSCIDESNRTLTLTLNTVALGTMTKEIKVPVTNYRQVTDLITQVNSLIGLAFPGISFVIEYNALIGRVFLKSTSGTVNYSWDNATSPLMAVLGFPVGESGSLSGSTVLYAPSSPILQTLTNMYLTSDLPVQNRVYTGNVAVLHGFISSAPFSYLNKSHGSTWISLGEKRSIESLRLAMYEGQSRKRVEQLQPNARWSVTLLFA